MPNVFVEPTKDGQYQIEFADHTPTSGPFKTQQEAINQAKRMGTTRSSPGCATSTTR